MKAEYDKIAGQFAQERQYLSALDGELIGKFMSLFPACAQILDLGCGTGIPIGRKLMEAGFLLTGVDRSRKLLDLARSNLPGVQLVEGEIEEFRFSERFDGVICWDAIFHIPRADHAPILSNIHTHLKPGGAVLLTSGGSPNEPFTDFMFGVEFFYDAHPPETLVQIAQDTGFLVEQLSVLDKPDGQRDKGRIGLLLRKVGE